MPRWWAFAVGIAAFIALTIDVRGQGIEEQGAKVAQAKCGTCNTTPEQPAIVAAKTRAISIERRLSRAASAEARRGSQLRAYRGEFVFSCPIHSITKQCKL